MSIQMKTRLNKDAEPKITQLKIIWDGTEEQMQELAKRSIVIAVQSNFRAAESVPSEHTVKVSELFNRAPRVAKALTAEQVAERAKANPEFLAELKKLLAAK